MKLAKSLTHSDSPIPNNSSPNRHSFLSRVNVRVLSVATRTVRHQRSNFFRAAQPHEPACFLALGCALGEQFSAVDV